MSARRWLGALATVCLVAVGCGVPTDDAPVAVEVPDDVFPTGPGGGEVPDSDEPNLSRHPVHFFRNDGLVEVDRALQPPVFIRVVLESLLAGPTQDELEKAFTSSIPAGTAVVTVNLGGDDNVVRIELNEAFFEVEGEQRIRATAQLVFTGFGLARDTQGVLFFFEGDPVALPKGDGSIAEVPEGGTPDPLTRSDYIEFIPQPVGSQENPLPEVTGEG